MNAHLRIRTRLDIGSYPKVEENDNGVTVYGPDFPRGKVISADTKDFEKVLQDTINGQSKTMINALTEYANNINKEYEEQLPAFKERVDEIINRIKE